MKYEVYCDSPWCEVAHNCARHGNNVRSEETLTTEAFDVDGECEEYEPIEEDV